jgi:hypothetical protein
MTATETFLERDHASLGKLFAEFEAVLNQVDAARAFDLLDLIWARLGIHIRAEHLCLFPAILDAPAQRFTGSDRLPGFAEAEAAVLRLRGDHDFFMHELAGAVNTLRRLKESKAVSGREIEEVRASVERVRARLEEHNRLEEEQAYKWINIILNEEEQAELYGRVAAEFAKHPPRFRERAAFPTADDDALNPDAHAE